jgi:hypothetical protein
MALEDFIVDITGKVAQNIEKIQHLFKVDKFNKIKNLVREFFSAFCLVLEAFFSAF